MSTHDESYLQLSAAQREVWFAEQVLPGTSTYIASEYLEIRGPLDRGLFEAALRRTMSEAETLQVRLVETAEGPRQVVLRDFPWELSYEDFGSDDAPDAAADTWLREQMKRPFDLAHPPLFNHGLLRLAEDRHFWYHGYHHAVMDQFAMSLIARRVPEVYTALLRGEQVPDTPFLPLAELLSADAAYRSSEDFDRDRDFWADRLAGWNGPVDLGGSASGTAEPGAIHRRTVQLSAEDSEALRAVADTESVRWPRVLIAATAVYLHRLTGERDIVIGTPVPARPDSRAQRVPAMASNVLPLRLTVEPDMTLGAVVAQVSSGIREIMAHQRHRGEEVVRALGLSGGIARGFAPFANMIPFSYEVAFGDSRATVHNVGPGMIGRLSVLVWDRSDGAGFRMDVVADARTHSAQDVDVHSDRLVHVLKSVAATPEKPVRALELSTAQERSEALAAGTGASVDVPPATLHELFEAQTSRTPDAPALRSDGQELTYAQLDERADGLAHALAERGVGPEDVVAVALPRSTDLVVSLLAVLKTGAAYLPVDPGLPAERLRHMLDDARPVLLLTHERIAAGLPAVPVTTLSLDGPCAAADPAADSAARRRTAVAPAPDHAAYVIYTSGSTGRPKGVVVPHRGIVNRLHWMQEQYGLTPDDRVLQKTPAGFDVSVWEFFWPLATGAVLVLAKPDGHRDAAYLTRLVRSERITTIHFVPSMLRAFLGDPGAADCATVLRRVICSGEALPVDLQDSFLTTFRNDGVELHNLYGPTEASVDVTSWQCAPEPDATVVPIGRAVTNTRLYVLDQHLSPVPQGMTGELYIAGDQVARGYLRRQELTAGRFVADPFGEPGGRMYRTGDLARLRADGALEFLGRTDDQVKLRGFRIEPGEIETALAQHASVAHAAVVVRHDQPGDERLVGYVVPSGETPVDPVEVKAHLARYLPDYMVPAALVVLDELPLSHNGKLDRKALPAPAEAAAGGGREPRGPREEILCGLFAEVLGVARVGVDDDFFALGGHSLLAGRLIGRVRAELGVELEIRALFESSTVAELAGRLTEGDVTRPELTPVARPQDIPLSFAQQRLWFLHRLEGPSPTYNMPLVLELSGTLDRTALRLALADVVARHESLRTVFPPVGGVPRQVIRPTADVPLPVTDVADRAELDTMVRERARHAFDLSVETPLRAELFSEGPTKHVLLVLIHHIAADGWSLSPFAQDLTDAYRARHGGGERHRPELPVQYADYTLWQRRLLGDATDPDSRLAEQVAYWREALAGLPDQLDLPTDRPRPAVESHRGDMFEFRIAPELHQGLADLARRSGASLYMVLQAGLAALFHRLGAGTDIPLGCAIAGRTDQALDDAVGLFVNTLVLRTDTSGDPTFAELLKRVRATTLDAFENQDVPFEYLVEELNPTRSAGRHPLFQTALVLQNSPTARFDLPGLGVEAALVGAGAARADMFFSLSERWAVDGGLDGLDGFVEYSSDLFDAATVESVVERWLRLLSVVVEDADVAIGSVDVLSGDERRGILEAGRGPVFGGGAEGGCWPGLFGARVGAAPDDVALVSGGVGLSYGEVMDRAGRLARLLVARGAGPGVLVGVALPRSAGGVVGLLAVLLSGAA
ncbi:amino acid adenylation domain-containing protein, partial [Streptomyces sp. NPDC002559]